MSTNPVREVTRAARNGGAADNSRYSAASVPSAAQDVREAASQVLALDPSTAAVFETLQRRIREDPTADAEERRETLAQLEEFKRGYVARRASGGDLRS